MDAVLYLQISSYRDEAGDRANQNADAQKNRENLAEVVYVIPEQAHSAENGSDFRVNPDDNRIENNHREQSREKSVYRPFHDKRPAGEPIAGADQYYHFYLIARRINSQADSVEGYQNGNKR